MDIAGGPGFFSKACRGQASQLARTHGAFEGHGAWSYHDKIYKYVY